MTEGGIFLLWAGNTVRQMSRIMVPERFCNTAEAIGCLEVQKKGEADVAETFPEGFLIGGATSDWQYEGGFGEDGRGLLTVDFVTDGSKEEPRRVTWKAPDGTRGGVPIVLSSRRGGLFNIPAC